METISHGDTSMVAVTMTTIYKVNSSRNRVYKYNEANKSWSEAMKDYPSG